MTTHGEPLEIPVDQIDPPAYELRLDYDTEALNDLAQDIATRGLLQPIGVTHNPDTDRYTRVWGGRRLAAHRLLAKPKIKALLVDAASDTLTAALAENLYRHDLSPVEEAHWIKAALGAGQTRDQLRLRLHRSDTWIDGRLELLDWPHDILHHLHLKQLPLTVAAALALIDNDEYRAYLIASAITAGCSGTAARAWLADYQAQRPRILSNQATIEQLKQHHSTARILLPCDGCEQPTDLSELRTWRLCQTCQKAVDAEMRQDPNG